MKTKLYLIALAIATLFSSCYSDCKRKLIETNHNYDSVVKELTIKSGSLKLAKIEADSLTNLLKLVTDRGCIIQKDPNYKDVAIWNLPAFQKLQAELKTFDNYSLSYMTPEYKVAVVSWSEAFDNRQRHKKEMLMKFANQNPTEFKKWGIAAIWAYTFSEGDDIYELERNSESISSTIGAITEYQDPNEEMLSLIIDSISKPYWDKRKNFEVEKWEEFKKVNKL